MSQYKRHAHQYWTVRAGDLRPGDHIVGFPRDEIVVSVHAVDWNVLRVVTTEDVYDCPPHAPFNCSTKNVRRPELITTVGPAYYDQARFIEHVKGA